MTFLFCSTSGAKRRGSVGPIASLAYLSVPFSFSRNSFQTSRGVSVHIVRWHPRPEAILSCAPPTAPRKSGPLAHPSFAAPPPALLSRAHVKNISCLLFWSCG